jgi:hypothetical protein
MTVQVDKLKKQQDDIIRYVREAENKVDKVNNENTDPVYKTEMEL